jgi:hypothetical protein
VLGGHTHTRLTHATDCTQHSCSLSHHPPPELPTLMACRTPPRRLVQTTRAFAATTINVSLPAPNRRKPPGRPSPKLLPLSLMPPSPIWSIHCHDLPPLSVHKAHTSRPPPDVPHTPMIPARQFVSAAFMISPLMAASDTLRDPSYRYVRFDVTHLGCFVSFVWNPHAHDTCIQSPPFSLFSVIRWARGRRSTRPANSACVRDAQPVSIARIEHRY